MTEFDDTTKSMIFGTLVNWWLDKARYAEDIRALAPKLVSAALYVYTEALGTLLPTPSRSHYTFNLRDLSKVFQGMQCAGGTLKSAEGMARLWVHEMLRVFADRLISDEDRDLLTASLQRAVDQHLKLKWYAAQITDLWLASATLMFTTPYVVAYTSSIV
jgi:dynein heavy chain, axonemal